MKIPSPPTCSVKNCKLGDHIISSLQESDAGINGNSTKEAPETRSCISKGSESVLVKKQCFSENLVMEGKVDFDVDVEFAEKNFSERSLLLKELETSDSHSQLSNSSIGNKGEQKCHQNPSEDAALATSTVSSQELHDKYNHELDYASTTTTSEVERERGRERNSMNADSQQPLRMENMSRLEHGPQESLAMSSQSPLLCQIPYSGNVSLRSTSSTASTRSFAFPVLPAEWNGSPVRLVESVNRQSRKRPRWRTCFLCFKF